MSFESVHPMRSWDDLRARLAHNRRCFVFFHPTEPRIPLVVLHVALTDRIESSIDRLLNSGQKGEAGVDEASASTAIFYSINNTQPGYYSCFFVLLIVFRSLGVLCHAKL